MIEKPSLLKIIILFLLSCLHGCLEAQSRAMPENASRAMQQDANTTKLDALKKYDRQQEHKEAQLRKKETISITQEINNIQASPGAYIAYAKNLLASRDYPKAKLVLDSARRLMRDDSRKVDWKDFYQVSSEYYKATGNMVFAFDNSEKYNLYKDSLSDETNRESLSILQAQYEAYQTQQEISERKHAVQRKDWMLMGICMIALLLALLGIISYGRHRSTKDKQMAKEAAQQQDLATKALLRAEESERRQTAVKLHDGVGQMMSAAHMNLSALGHEPRLTDGASKQKFERIITLVNDSCKEIIVLSRQMMPGGLLKTGLANAVRDLVERIDSRALKVNLYIEGFNKRIDTNTESVLYRVIQECVNNVTKHSGANELDISLIKETNSIHLTIEDNGKGFDTSGQYKFEGIGIKNILARINYLKGEVDFDSKPGHGALVAIHVPLV